MGSDSKALMHQNHLPAFPKPFETKALMEKRKHFKRWAAAKLN
jgi:hypothetical protein